MTLKIHLQPKKRIYKYELIRKVGGGNFGEAWLAHDITIQKQVVVKVLDESMNSVANILKEAQTGHHLEHSNVVKIHYADVVLVDGNNIVLIVMDFHPNGSVLNHLNPSNFLAIDKAVKITIDILRGLDYLHERRLYHNDIKPSNILFGAHGEGILTDYGISCSSPDLQPVSTPIAYFLHRAPETSATNLISIQTDIYQTGLTLFRLVNGIGLIEDLKNRLGVTEFEKLKSQDKIPRPNDFQLFVPRQLKTIINKAIRANPADRYQSALEMRRSLETIKIYGFWETDATGKYFGYYNMSPTM